MRAHLCVERDDQIRNAARMHTDRLLAQGPGDVISNLRNETFTFGGEQIRLVDRQRGIRKPRQMSSLLSIRTKLPRSGRSRYNDQHQAMPSLRQGDTSFSYSFMGNDPEHAENQYLLQAKEQKIPLIYFLEIREGINFVIQNAYVTEWIPEQLEAKISIGLPKDERKYLPDEEDTRQYTVRVVKQRLHQATFRHDVVSAYQNRCALTNLPEPLLLDAAHIVPDTDFELGQPIVPNGLPLLKTHHAAFDNNLIGITPDYKVVVSGRLMAKEDGETLEALKALHNRTITLPRQQRHHPDRDRLSCRYEQFRQANS